LRAERASRHWFWSEVSELKSSDLATRCKTLGIETKGLDRKKKDDRNEMRVRIIENLRDYERLDRSGMRRLLVNGMLQGVGAFPGLCTLFGIDPADKSTAVDQILGKMRFASTSTDLRRSSGVSVKFGIGMSLREEEDRWSQKDVPSPALRPEASPGLGHRTQLSELAEDHAAAASGTGLAELQEDGQEEDSRSETPPSSIEDGS
jgi:hypothetical protein